MGIFDKLNGFNSPITRGRRTCGCCVIGIGLIMLIPSIIGLLWAGSIYNNAEVNFNNSQMVTSPAVGTNVTITATDIFNAGNNYDVRYYVTAVGPNTLEQTGSYAIVIINDGLESVMNLDRTMTNTGFNGTTTSISSKLEMENDFTTSYSPVDFTFTISSFNNVTSFTFQVRVYENPNRRLVSIMNSASLIIAIPGAIVCCCGLVIAPPGKKE